jgi:hypothetical protein
MAIYTPNAVDFLNPRIWTGVVRDLPIPQEYVGFKWLPERNVPADKLQWDMIKAENPLAPLVAVDAESPRMDDEELVTSWADVTYVKFKRTLSAGDVRIIRDFGQAPVLTMGANMRDAAMAKITRQAARLSRAIDARMEWMQINALLGGFSYSPNSYSNLTITINYGVQQVTPTTLWSDTVNADPLNDMIAWFQNLTFVPKTAIMSNVAFNYLARNQKVTRQVGYAEGVMAGQQATVIPPGMVQRFFSSFLNMDVALYNARYTTYVDNGTSKTITLNRFLPTNMVIFLPDVPVGYTASAPAEQNNFQSGKFAWTVDPNQPGAKKDPWLYELGAGYYGLPIVELPQWIVVATIA